MLRVPVILLALASVACLAYPLPAAPDPVVVVKPTAPITSLQLAANTPDQTTGAAPIVVSVDGQGVVDCQSTLGRVEPPSVRFATPSGYLVHLVGATMPAVVTCHTGDVVRTTPVDMTAWRLVLAAIDEFNDIQILTENSDTVVTYQLVRRVPGVAIRSASIYWGDGASEPLLGQVDGRAPTRMTHRYGRQGEFQIRTHIEWDGGFDELTIIITRHCAASDSRRFECSVRWRMP